MNDTDSELMSICAETCLNCDGVSRMTSHYDTTDYLKEIAGLESGEKGVRMSKEKGMLTFDLYVRVRYGENIPVLAWNIQHKVTEALKEKTDDKIKEVNIHVQGVDLG